MDKNDSIANHVAKLEDIAQKLKDLNEPESSSMIMTKIIMTLPPSFNHFYSAWESTSAPEKTLANLTSRLMVEKARIHTQVSEKDSSAFVSKKQFKRYDNNKYGHWKKDCKSVSNNVANKHDAFLSEVFLTARSIDSSKWFMDSGASDHMPHQKNSFINYKKFENPIKVRNGATVFSYGKGDIGVLCFDGENWTSKTLLNVLYKYTRNKIKLVFGGRSIRSWFEYVICMRSIETRMTCE